MFLVLDRLGRDHGRGGRRPEHLHVSIAAWLWLTVLFGNLAEAVAEGRGKAQAASLRATRTDTVARLLDRRRLRDRGAGDPAEGRRPRGRRGRRGHPRRRRRRRGRRRPSTSRRSPASPPRSSARPAATAAPSPAAPACCPTGSSSRITAAAGRDLPRQDDRAGRGHLAAQDAQRDRPVDPAGRPHAHLPARRRDARPDGGVRRRTAGRRRAGRPAGLPDPDHDRRPAVRHRHRRHGPPGAGQRARHVGPGGRGRRRRQHAAARQDRHHHLRQPPGQPRSCRRPGVGQRRAARRRPALQPRRPDPGGSLDRRPRPHRRAPTTATCPGGASSSSSPPRPGCRGVDLADGTADPQGRRLGRSPPGSASSSPSSCRPIVEEIAVAGGTPLVVAEGPPRAMGRCSA